MEVDWDWKLREAVERIKTAYAHIGRSSGAPILAIVYPPDQEIAVLKEWHALAASLGKSFDVRPIDALEVTARAVEEFGVEAVVANLADPMPGSDANAELGRHWVRAMAARIHELLPVHRACLPGCNALPLERWSRAPPARDTRQENQDRRPPPPTAC